jgi:hypothetical protein
VALRLNAGTLLCAHLRMGANKVFVVDSTNEPKLYMHKRVDVQDFKDARAAGRIELVRVDDVSLREYWRVR